MKLALTDSDAPALCNLTGRITRDNDYCSAHGGFSDIWMGTWLKGIERCKVAIKVLRVSNENEDTQERMNKRLHKEILVWQMLKHENVLPLLGITFDVGRNNPMGMVSPWVENGDLSGYLNRCGAALALWDRLRILCEVAAGLRYLHSSNVVHGDLSGSNVFIDGDGKALLADFGLSNIVTETYRLYVTSSIGGSVRWAAPEHFRPSRDRHVSTVTTHSDIYSYGSVILQTLSGKIPYHHLKRDAEVLLELNQGVHPPRPPELADEHWALIWRCWAEVPSARPAVTEVFGYVQYHFRPSSVGVSGASDCQPAKHSQTLACSPDSTQPSVVGHGIAKSVITLAVVCICVLPFLLLQAIAFSVDI